MSRHGLPSPHWTQHAQGDGCDSCREITKLVLWDVIGWFAALAVLFASMGLLW